MNTSKPRRNWLRTIFKGLGIFIFLLLVIYLLGPRAPKPTLDPILPTVSTDLSTLEADIKLAESAVTNLKPDNEARIVWFDPTKKEKTPYSLVYLHGFSASQGEGDPMHLEFAQRYGANLYLARIDGHGIENGNNLLEITPESLIASAKKAIAIGKALGEKVILMSCSTGGTYSLYLSGDEPAIAGQILYSPNIDIYDSKTNLLTKPWGYQMLKFLTGGVQHTWDGNDNVKKYWQTTYRIEAIIALKSLIQATMLESTFKKIKSPVFLGYYYKDEENQDKVVSVERMKEMFSQLSTPDDQKRAIAFPNSGAHVMCSKYFPNDLENLRKETFAFAEEVMGLKEVSLVKEEMPVVSEVEEAVQ